MSEILSDAELLRYNRQIILKSFDFEGQEALKQAHVLVIGAGGLGCAASQYLAVAGVGQLTLVDFDRVELSNLQRQVLHTDERIGHYKVDSAAQSLRALNPWLKVETHAAVADEALLDTLLPQHQLVLDCTDNLAIRNLLNQRARQHGVPLAAAPPSGWRDKSAASPGRRGSPATPASAPCLASRRSPASRRGCSPLWWVWWAACRRSKPSNSWRGWAAVTAAAC